MVWYARSNQLKLTRGNSGLRPTCIPTLVGFFIGDFEMKRILLSQRQYAIVDDKDYEWLSRNKWYAYWNKDTKSFYAGLIPTITIAFTIPHILLMCYDS